MNDRQRAVNQDLQTLGDAYRLGQIQRDEYRLRRRHVLAGLRAGDDADTTRKPIRSGSGDAARVRASAASPQAAAYSPAAAAAHRATGTAPAPVAASGVAWRYWLLFGLGLLLAAAALAMLVRAPDESPVPASAPTARSPLAELEASASAFTDRDDWQPAAVDAWVARWQRIDAGLRRQALARPALQHLRDQASYQLSVRKALAAPESGGDERDAGAASLEQLLKALDPAA